MMQAYIDTNILVDLVLARQEFLPDAQRVFALGYAGEVQLTVSALSFVNTVYLARKYKYPLDEVYSKLRLVADFVYVADLSGQKVLSGTVSDMSKLDGKTLIGMDVLEDAATNDIAALATRLDGKQTNVALADRTLYKDGAWNTLCLPFDVEDGNTEDGLTFSGTPLTGATVMELDVEGTYDTNKQTGLATDGTLYLYFKDANKVVAGKPYIIKWDGDGTNNLVDPVFTEVSVISDDPTPAQRTGGDVAFTGSYSPAAIAVDNKACLFLGVSTVNGQEVSTLYYPDTSNYENFPNLTGATAENYYLGAFRAYFQVDLGNGLGVYPAPTTVRSFVLNFGEEGEAQGITTTDYTDFTDKAGAWYTIDGVRLDGKPTKKGLYIHGGRKVVIP